MFSQEEETDLLRVSSQPLPLPYSPKHTQTNPSSFWGCLSDKIQNFEMDSAYTREEIHKLGSICVQNLQKTFHFSW